VAILPIISPSIYQASNKSKGVKHMQELVITHTAMQEYRQTYTPQKALTRGTLFAELDLPLEPEKGREAGQMSQTKGGCGCGKGKESADGSCLCG
jgi:hypothetical protein